MPDAKRNIMDIIAGIFLILLAVIVYLDSANIKIIADTTLDASFYPKFLAVMAVILSTIMIIRAGINLKRILKRNKSALHFPSDVRGEVTSALATLALLGGYVCLIEPLGFLVATPFYIFGQALVLAPHDKKRPLLFAGLGILSTIVIYCVFKYGFQLMVPMGILR